MLASYTREIRNSRLCGELRNNEEAVQILLWSSTKPAFSRDSKVSSVDELRHMDLVPHTLLIIRMNESKTLAFWTRLQIVQWFEVCSAFSVSREWCMYPAKFLPVA